MRAYLTPVAVVIALYFFTVPSTAFPWSVKDGEIIVSYRGYQNYGYELMCDSRGRVTLQIDISKDLSMTERDSVLERMKMEVVRLVSTGKIVKLGNSGLSFQFNKGYPIWGPYGQWSQMQHTVCLLFAKNCVVVNGVIRASGTLCPHGYYPYPDTIRSK